MMIDWKSQLTLDDDDSEEDESTEDPDKIE
jgi:hypothetical protein